MYKNPWALGIPSYPSFGSHMFIACFLWAFQGWKKDGELNMFLESEVLESYTFEGISSQLIMILWHGRSLPWKRFRRNTPEFSHSGNYFPLKDSVKALWKGSLKKLFFFFLLSQLILTTILQGTGFYLRRNLRHKEINWFVQGHLA